MTLIRNRNQVKQAIDFTGIENGLIHPTDIDAVLEFDNEILILIEVKKKGNKIPTGQRLALERICEAWRTPKSIVLYVTHEFEDDRKDIPLQDCYVEQYYTQQTKWKKLSRKKLKNTLNFLGMQWNCPKLKL
ncbi:MAG: hypothetical protein H8E55_51625 [Pelagibacterales bacterium]|nr:hypothetical protein [Pelagibacterales bacterium]